MTIIRKIDNLLQEAINQVAYGKRDFHRGHIPATKTELIEARRLIDLALKLMK